MTAAVVGGPGKPGKLVIVGTGRLGRALVRRLPAEYELVALHRAAAAQPFSMGRAALTTFDQLEPVRGSAAVLLAVPTGALVDVLARLRPYLDARTVVVNMATESDTRQLQQVFPEVVLVAAKLIGQAGAIEQGSPGVLLVDHASDEVFTLLSRIFRPIGLVDVGREATVLAANSAVAEEMVRADRAIRSRLTELSLDQPAIDAAISTMAVGILRALCSGDIGPFLRRFVEA